MKQSLQSSKKVDASIIIVSYNTKDLTLQCIKSIAVSTKNIKYEIIVVDNASGDGTAKLIRNSKLNVNVIENDENLGFAKANNQGIQIAQGKYVLLLNSDTEVQKGTIEKLIKFADKKKNVGAIVPKLLNLDNSTQTSVLRLPTILHAIKQSWLGQKGLLDKYCPTKEKPVEVESAVMAAFLITPKALKIVGLLDERYFMFFEDLDYCRSLKRAGLKIYYLPNAEVIHHHGASGKDIADNKNQWRRLAPSSKIYHGLIGHYVFNFVLWSGQKCQKYLKTGN
jgi:GT2 family glycosyltransferase